MMKPTDDLILIPADDVPPALRWFASSMIRTACDDLGLDIRKIALYFFSETPDSLGLVMEGACAEGRIIYVSDSLGAAALTAVLAHELRHCAQRLMLGPTVGDADRRLRELDADFYATSVMRILGYAPSGRKNGHG